LATLVVVGCDRTREDVAFVDAYRDRMCRCKTADCARAEASSFRNTRTAFTTKLLLPDSKRASAAAYSAAVCCIKATEMPGIKFPGDGRACNHPPTN
jgi:hypothetical protein